MAQRQPAPPRPRPLRAPSDSTRTRGRSDRAHRPQELLRASFDARERMLEQIYRITFEVARDLKLNRTSVRRAFQKAQRSAARSPFQLREAAGYQVIHQIGDIL